MKNFIGYLIVFISTIGYAIIPPMMKKVSVKLPPFTSIAISMFVLFLGSLILSIMFENGLNLKFGNYKSQILILVLVGLVNTLAFYFAILGYKYMPIWQQSLFLLLTPALSGIFAFWILHEQISPKLFISLIIMGIGLFLAIN